MEIVRRAKRILVDEPARLHPNHWSSLEVRLLDYSDEGFRAQCEARVREGDLVTLEVPGIGPTQAQVTWCRDGDLGARFLQPVSLRKAAVKALPPENALARLLVQRAAAHRTNRRDEEEALRREILKGLPVRRG